MNKYIYYGEAKMPESILSEFKKEKFNIMSSYGKKQSITLFSGNKPYIIKFRYFEDVDLVDIIDCCEK